ncbi:hypothetical protein LSH36_325g01010 [Paralvinella palmiformis]|uniref:Uncharacterized protein n=1 Tax=Paralvinella palmiformis TaxID=53620 RepID=A0AAD9N216_9ANNE|nr:hypothetical protein LSH36_325g01010 [Paralvinella palmiformis]
MLVLGSFPVATVKQLTNFLLLRNFAGTNI